MTFLSLEDFLQIFSLSSHPLKKAQTLAKKSRVTWARLLKRVFDIDVETCGVCGGKVKIISAIKETEVIKKILDHIGLPSVPPEIASARGPPSITLITISLVGCSNFDSSPALQP